MSIVSTKSWFVFCDACEGSLGHQDSGGAMACGNLYEAKDEARKQDWFVDEEQVLCFICKDEV